MCLTASSLTVTLQKSSQSVISPTAFMHIFLPLKNQLSMYNNNISDTKADIVWPFILVVTSVHLQKQILADVVKATTYILHLLPWLSSH